MKPTDTSEKGLESLIVRYLITHGYVLGHAKDYAADVALDTVQLLAFLQATQPEVITMLNIAAEGMPRVQFLHRLQGEITKRGVVDVLRKGINHGPAHLDIYKYLPTPGNDQATRAFAKNMFSVTRQVRYSKTSGNTLDIVIFINGLPLLTMELKNSLTKQTVSDAINQYKTTRNPRELLFQSGRCIAHFAIDDVEVRFCTELKGKDSWFLPFNKGHNSGAGNPPNPDGLKTDFMWKDILEKSSLADIIENFAQIVEEDTEITNGRKKKIRKPIFPRFHQLRTVRALLRRTMEDGIGQRYLIQHSAGSGKSNTITWLAYQLVSLRRKEDTMAAQFDSIIVITDRRALDTQIARTMKSYDHVTSVIGHSEDSKQLRNYLHKGKKIIITTVQKFPFVLDVLSDLSKKSFALLIDEAHSSQGGKTTEKMHEILSGDNSKEDYEEDTIQEAVNAEIEKRIQLRRMLKNVNYFAFTATPKRKTLELFGEKTQVGDTVQFCSPVELTYTTKQAIEEGFILDVIAHYMPVESFYQVAKIVESDPEFDKAKALKKIHHYVESHNTAIAHKAEIMVDHFIEQVIETNKIGGKARAMIVCNGIARAVDYYHAISSYLERIKSQYKAIIAFSGEFEIAEQKKTETDLNKFPSKDIPNNFKKDPYRFLIVANKFITGFDEPLLHSMYVDKPLAGVQAVQTLSRLNRAHPQKYDTFVLDFSGNQEAVRVAFQDYYQTTIQDGATDPNQLHDLKDKLDNAQVYTSDQVESFVSLYLSGADREVLDPILDNCVAAYQSQLDEKEKINFKGRVRAFLRRYSFLATILPWGKAEWEKLSIFMSFLIHKLPAPLEEYFSTDVLDSIDMESYRIERKAILKIAMKAEDAVIKPIVLNIGSNREGPEQDKLSNIVQTFNSLFGSISWSEEDKIKNMRLITEDIPEKVINDTKYQNARINSDRNAAKLEHDLIVERIINDWVFDHTELFKQFSDNPSFKRWLIDTSFNLTWQQITHASNEVNSND